MSTHNDPTEERPEEKPGDFPSTAQTDMPVQVIRSQRRVKTISARVTNGTLVVRIPAWMSAEEEATAVANMRAKVAAKRTNSRKSDADLEQRAHVLNKQYLSGRASFTSIRWVTNQNSRWGSCTPSTQEIRLSHRLQDVPGYVLDSVIVHELVHTFISGHGPDFWEWADKAPRAERAKGYLEAYSRFAD